MNWVAVREAKEYRDATFERIAGKNSHDGWAHQHHLWPCVRRGAAERWFAQQGRDFPASKTMLLYFLRGHSAEYLISDANKEHLVLIYKGVACRPDLMSDNPLRPFFEIKSTNFSSYQFWQIVKAGGLNIESPFAMKNYLEQAARYCVAMNVTQCYLLVFFLHGDYGDRRKNCPDCGNAFAQIDRDTKQCPVCEYKTRPNDMRVYELDFPADYLAQIDAEYDSRGLEFYAAIKATTIAELHAATTPTPCYSCRDCKLGAEIDCENAGKEFD